MLLLTVVANNDAVNSDKFYDYMQVVEEKQVKPVFLPNSTTQRVRLILFSVSWKIISLKGNLANSGQRYVL